MEDEIERRLREGLHTAPLPPAPDALNETLLGLSSVAAPKPRMLARLQAWMAPVSVAILSGVLLVGAVIIASRVIPPATGQSAGAAAAASPSAAAPPSRAPASTLPAVVDGLQVKTVPEVLAERSTGELKDQPVALGGFWSDRNFAHSCVPPLEPPGALELYCHDGEWGITEEREAILVLKDNQVIPAQSPHLTPWVPEKLQQQLFALPVINGQRFPPVPILVVGHFDDPRAKECRTEAEQLCADRFVLDQIVSFDVDSVPPPAATASPTPFPSTPPAALFTTDSCYDGVPKSFIGWTTTDKLAIQFEREGHVFAMVTRDVIPIGDWFETADYPGHQARWWGQGVCVSQDGNVVEFGSVGGTTFLALDDGRRIPGQAP